ncbi:MAG: hypothetical protein EOM10_06780 [Opitutae bacterium]|nr:hypothetical protein [Kiritimatiellia bacterium]NCC92973.1 hypothetical protein [Opitutae bacterium]
MDFDFLFDLFEFGVAGPSKTAKWGKNGPKWSKWGNKPAKMGKNWLKTGGQRRNYENRENREKGWESVFISVHPWLG